MSELKQAKNLKSITQSHVVKSKGFQFFDSQVHCGLFGIQDDFIEDSLSLDEKFLAHRESRFLVRASGDSMNPEVKDNDILIVDRSIRPVSHSIITFFLNSSPMCKEFITHSNRIILRSFNKGYSDIEVGECDEFIVFGVVVGIVRETY